MTCSVTRSRARPLEAAGSAGQSYHEPPRSRSVPDPSRREFGDPSPRVASGAVGPPSTSAASQRSGPGRRLPRRLTLEERSG